MDNGDKYNVSFYSISWDNPQVNAATPTYGYYAVINGEDAETSGMDVELSGTRGPVDWNIGYQSFKLASALCRRELRRVENDESPLSRCNHVYSAVG